MVQTDFSFCCFHLQGSLQIKTGCADKADRLDPVGYGVSTSVDWDLGCL